MAATRFVVAEIPPLTLALLRYAIGAACLLPFVPGAVRRVWLRHPHSGQRA